MANEKLVERLLWHGEFHIGEAEVSISYQFLDELVEALRAQPSAASGRELFETFLATLPNGAQANIRESMHRGESHTFNAFQFALTGAAPADANVGGRETVKALAEGSVLSHGVIQNLEQARDAADQARREGLQGMYPAACIVLDMAFSRLSHAIRTTTAPEPSAPADKDAERYRWLISGHTLSELEDAARAGQQPRMTPQMEIIAHLATWYNCQEDKREIDTMIDAAIARMCSEDGKGGKL